MGGGWGLSPFPPCGLPPPPVHTYTTSRQIVIVERDLRVSRMLSRHSPPPHIHLAIRNLLNENGLLHVTVQRFLRLHTSRGLRAVVRATHGTITELVEDIIHILRVCHPLSVHDWHWVVDHSIGIHNSFTQLEAAVAVRIRRLDTHITQQLRYQAIAVSIYGSVSTIAKKILDLIRGVGSNTRLH